MEGKKNKNNLKLRKSIGENHDWSDNQDELLLECKVNKTQGNSSRPRDSTSSNTFTCVCCIIFIPLRSFRPKNNLFAYGWTNKPHGRSLENKKLRTCRRFPALAARMLTIFILWVDWRSSPGCRQHHISLCVVGYFGKKKQPAALLLKTPHNGSFSVYIVFLSGARKKNFFKSQSVYLSRKRFKLDKRRTSAHTMSLPASRDLSHRIIPPLPYQKASSGFPSCCFATTHEPRR